MAFHTLSPDGPSRRHGGLRFGPGSEGCHDFCGAGPAGSPVAGGRAPRDVAGPGAKATPAASPAGDALTKRKKKDPAVFLQNY